jgi:chromosome segregation ATPase
MTKITKEFLYNEMRDIMVDFNLWKERITNNVSELKEKIDISKNQAEETPQSHHNLQMQIDTLKGFRVSMQAEINGMKEWISELEKQQTQPNVTIPKSTRYDAEVGSRLDSLEARMAMVEDMFKTEPEPQTENQSIMPKEYGGILKCEQAEQTELKIVFDWFINQEGKAVVPYSNPNEFDRIEERFKLGDKFYLFSAHYSQGAPIKIYIGHYE